MKRSGERLDMGLVLICFCLCVCELSGRCSGGKSFFSFISGDEMDIDERSGFFVTG